MGVTHVSELIELISRESNHKFAVEHADRRRHCAFSTNRGCQRVTERAMRRGAACETRTNRGGTRRIGEIRNAHVKRRTGKSMRHRSGFKRNDSTPRRQRVSDFRTRSRAGCGAHHFRHRLLVFARPPMRRSGRALGTIPSGNRA